MSEDRHPDDERAPASDDGLDETPATSPDGPAPEDTVALLEDRLRRALADLDNLRKRYEREVARERAAERARVAAQWLPVVDDLERALEHGNASADVVVEGVRAVRDRALAVLAQLGFPRYEDTGAPFDPARHEAVGVVDSDASPGTVVAAVRPGYGTDGAILRPAGVVVARSGQGAEPDVVARDPG